MSLSEDQSVVSSTCVRLLTTSCNMSSKGLETLLHHPHARTCVHGHFWCQRRPEVAPGFQDTGVTGCCELPSWYLLHVILNSMLPSLPTAVLLAQLQDHAPASTSPPISSSQLALPSCHQMPPSSLFLLLHTLALWKNNTRPLYYFKTSQITQMLGKEFPGLTLLASLFQPSAGGGGLLVLVALRPHMTVASFSFQYLVLRRPPLSLNLLFLFLLGPRSPTFFLSPTIGFSFLHLHNQEPIRDSAPPSTCIAD